MNVGFFVPAALLLAGCSSVPTVDEVMFRPPACSPQPLGPSLEVLDTTNVQGLQPIGTLCRADDRGLISGLAVASDGRIAAAGHGVARVWSVDGTERLAVRIDGKGRGIAWVDDDQAVAIGDESGTVRVVDASTGAVRWTVDEGEGSVWGLVQRNDELVVADAEGDLVRRSLATGEEQARSFVSDRLWAMAWDPRSSTLLVGGDEGVYAIDPVTLEVRHSVDHGHPTYQVVPAPVGPVRAAIGHSDIEIWREGKPSVSVRFGARALGWSPDGSLLAGGSWGSELVVVSPPRSVLARLEADQGRIQAVAFGPDGDWVATAGDGGLIRIWGVPVTPAP